MNAEQKRREIVIRALYAAINWEWAFLDCIKDCHDKQSNDTRKFTIGLIADYRAELKRRIQQRNSGKKEDGK